MKPSGLLPRGRNQKKWSGGFGEEAPAAFLGNRRRLLPLSRRDLELCAWARRMELTMADRRGLGILGCIFGGITMAVMATALVVVLEGLDGSYVSDSANVVLVSSSR